MKRILFLLLVIMILSGCFDFNDDYNNDYESIACFDSSLGVGSLEFTALITDTENIDYIIPLGNLNPPGHTFPSDHIYFVHGGIGAGKAIYAPASGKILEIYKFGDGDTVPCRVNIGVSDQYMYYMMHIILNKDLKVGDFVKAGQKIGVISGDAAAFDLGVAWEDTTNRFINPDRYGCTSIHCASPLKYYKEPYRTYLYSKVWSAGENKDGKICFDKKGTLAGNWVEKGISGEQIEGPETGKYGLAFVYDNINPGEIKISIGRDDVCGVYGVQDNAIRPENVTLESGIVRYYLTSEYSGNRIYTMLVRMIDDNMIKVEFFRDTICDTCNIDDKAWIYVR